MKRARPPQNACDVPGCLNKRRRFNRLCLRCETRLPAEIRVGIAEAHHQRRWNDHRLLGLRAAAFLNFTFAERLRCPGVSPQRAYEMQARLLGERTDA